MAVEYGVQLGDVTQVPSDLLLLKYAQSFYSSDGTVVEILEEKGVRRSAEMRPEPGQVITVNAQGVMAPKRVMFIGVPRLSHFRYKEIRQFARRAVEEIAKLSPPVQRMTTTIHGAGYGLDVEESLQAMVFGFQIGIAEHVPPGLSQLTFVELQPRRAAMVENALRLLAPAKQARATPSPSQSRITEAPVAAPAEKKVAFVAMPFSEEFEDVWEFGIYAPIRRCGYACEKVDVSTFAGDIVGRICEGIRDARFVVADLTTERPNVYLEVGYAWGLNKPVLLLAREGQRLHFDLSHHKCIFYRTIGKLAADLEKTVREMFGAGDSEGKP